MATRTRRNQGGGEQIYELGQKGRYGTACRVAAHCCRGAYPCEIRQLTTVYSSSRKTGVTLVDKGVRDEHGMEPVSGIFSSPGKEGSGSGSPAGDGRTSSGEADMDLDDGAFGRWPEIPLT